MRYRAIRPNEDGRLWSEVLELELGLWEGEYFGESAVWLRYFDEEGAVIPTFAEAEAAEAELEKVRKELNGLQGQ